MDVHVLTREGILQAQVCSAGTWDEALEWLCKNAPAGTTGNWGKDERGGKFAPIPCADDPKRTHYLFIC